MSTDLPDAVLKNLCGGDTDAAEQAFLAYEPYLRMLVRRWLSPRLRPKFDSVDIVQSVWVDVLQGFREGRWCFADARCLRAFLARATRNRFLNRVRQYQRDLQREQPLSHTDLDELPPAKQPQPGETVQAEELWKRLLALCPQAHRELLQLRQQGLTISAIAAHTGLHEGSVRRTLYDLARRFAFQEESASSRG